MLHAIAQGKSKLYRRYLGHRDGAETHVSEEDEITSTILGPLCLLDASDVAKFWRKVLQPTHQSAFLIDEDPFSAKVSLWPTRTVSGASRSRIEPDLLIELTWKGTREGETERKRILLCELKWRAPLSGENQLMRQWTKFLSPEERTDALHIFLGLDIAAGISALERKNVWGEAPQHRLVLMSWLEVRDSLKRIEGEATPLGRWAELSNRFLERLQVRQFRGIHAIEHEHLLHATTANNPIFWQPPVFKGLARFFPPSTKSLSGFQTIFFERR
ncbi:MAG: hypothetical protein AB7V26_07085 [Lysobacterales bacterium]